MVGALSGVVSPSVAGSGGWIVLLGAFLFAAARGSRKQAALRASLASVPVRELMVKSVVALSPDLTLEEAVNGFFLPYGFGGFPGMQEGRLIGVATVRDVQTVPNAAWGARRVADVMQTAVEDLVLSPDASIMQALEQMVARGAERLVVVQDGLVLGLVTRAAIGQFIELHRSRR